LAEQARSTWPEGKTPQLVDGSSAAPATLVLAHGAGAPMDSPFMVAMASGLAAQGWRVVRFEFDYMARARRSGRKAAPDRMPKLEEVFRSQVQQQAHAAGGPLIIGGKSMGGRVASMLLDGFAQDFDVRGGLCLGYPFHPLGKPDLQRTEHLEQMQTPLLILQGERDGFGTRAEVETYSLASTIQLGWLADGDHSFKPRKASGHTETENLSAAIAMADVFCRALVVS
jgi:predicted alpha/beta-hydrolase family hydrolase